MEKKMKTHRARILELKTMVRLAYAAGFYHTAAQRLIEIEAVLRDSGYKAQKSFDYPELVIENRNLENILTDYRGENVLFVTDPFNYPLVKNFGRAINVENISHRVSPFCNLDAGYDRVVGIGGCSALDIGRYHAAGIRFTGIPTILSTSCISVNSSIIRSKEGKKTIKTVIPDKTIIPLETVLSSEEAALSRYTASGIGDLMANISASIHYEMKHGSSSYENIKENAKEAFSAMDWILNEFSGYSESSMTRIAGYLHDSSVSVMKRGNAELSAGFEHAFYETIVQNENYSSDIQTHGFLVAAGAIITTSIYEQCFGNPGLTERLKSVYSIFGIPHSYKTLRCIGIEREHILRALQDLMNREGDNFVSRYLESAGLSQVDHFFLD